MAVSEELKNLFTGNTVRSDGSRIFTNKAQKGTARYYVNDLVMDLTAKGISELVLTHSLFENLKGELGVPLDQPMVKYKGCTLFIIPD